MAPEEETTYLVRGKIHESLGDLDAAADDYQQALDLNPFNEDACILKGSLLITKNLLDEAIVFFDEAIEIKPDFARLMPNAVVPKT